MPYVERDASGKVISMHQNASAPGAELLSPEHPDVLTFLYGEAQKAELLALDLGFIRVIEDLIYLLVSRNLIYFTDLPGPVQAKLNSRQRARISQSDNGLGSDIIQL